MQDAVVDACATGRIGGVLRYPQRPDCFKAPSSANNLLANLARGPANNPALWGGGYTFMNRVPGQPLFLVDPNSKFDPTKQLVLNPAAWVEPPYGTFGASAPYFNDYRWQRQPAESMAFGRVFRGQGESTTSRSGRNSRTSSIACSIPCPSTVRATTHRLAHGPGEQFERHHRPVVLRLRVCELGERRRAHCRAAARSSGGFRSSSWDRRPRRRFPCSLRSVLV